MHEKVIRVQYNQGVGETLHENPDRLNQHIRHRQFPRCSKVARGKFTESSTTGTALPLSVRDLGSKKDQADRCDSLQVGAPEPQEFRTQPVPFWLFCFSDTIKGALRQLYFVVPLPDGTVVDFVRLQATDFYSTYSPIRRHCVLFGLVYAALCPSWHSVAPVHEPVFVMLQHLTCPQSCPSASFGTLCTNLLWGFLGRNHKIL